MDIKDLKNLEDQNTIIYNGDEVLTQANKNLGNWKHLRSMYLIHTHYLLILLKQVLTILAESKLINTNGRKKI